jgi:hypothetical protein
VPWGGEKRRTCRACGRARKDGETFTARGNHLECGLARKQANDIQLHQHSGPFFDHWRARSLAALGVVRRDAPDSNTQTAD